MTTLDRYRKRYLNTHKAEQTKKAPVVEVAEEKPKTAKKKTAKATEVKTEERSE